MDSICPQIFSCSKEEKDHCPHFWGNIIFLTIHTRDIYGKCIIWFFLSRQKYCNALSDMSIVGVFIAENSLQSFKGGIQFLINSKFNMSRFFLLWQILVQCSGIFCNHEKQLIWTWRLHREYNILTISNSISEIFFADQYFR